MTTDDIVTILSAVGDSWPAAVVVVALVAAFIAVRALPKLKEITESLQALLREMKPNSGKTMRDALDRLEQSQQVQTRMLAEHIAEDQAWKAGVEEHLTGPDRG